MSYTVKRLKTWNTDEGGGWEVTLCLDGKAVATVLNRGDGGCFEFFWRSKKAADVEAVVPQVTGPDKPVTYRGTVEEAKLWAHVRTLPAMQIFGVTLSMDPDMFVEELVNDFELDRKLKFELRKPIALRGDEVLRWKQPLTPEFEARFDEAHPGAVLLNRLPFQEAFELMKTAQRRHY